MEDKYKLNGIIGEGSYGVVYQAYHTETSKYAAIKEYKKPKRGSDVGIMLSTIREIKLLKELNHEHIVKIEDIFCDTNERKLFIAFEYAEHDLIDILDFYKKQKMLMPEIIVKSLMWQILNGIHYLHTNWIIHRDLKPANILIKNTSEERGIAKIADFGLARIFQDPSKSLGKDGDVVTLWYRAPELLLGAQHYTPAIDMWSVGCIFAELIQNRELFHGIPAKNGGFEEDQIRKIINILGIPSTKWPECVKLPYYRHISQWEPQSNQMNLAQELRIESGTTKYNLISRMLKYDPKERITALDALKHTYFNEPPLPSPYAFSENEFEYPKRPLKRIHKLPQQILSNQQQQNPSNPSNPPIVPIDQNIPRISIPKNQNRNQNQYQNQNQNQIKIKIKINIKIKIKIKIKI
ncbi:cyclin-dependent kinase 10 [Anaeramoeba ignava]|uniref:Cyclin-dependent kinase 8 n=1 Tax=Anaeramoeba ignava TaxID=1746090 RepID=A0A9Q0RFP4_ANAIG|nr:cyclin-dependent kinase 10 [Anaeramoeba ignava]